MPARGILVFVLGVAALCAIYPFSGEKATSTEPERTPPIQTVADGEIADRRVVYRPGGTIPRVLHYTWPNKDFSFGAGEDVDGQEQRKILSVVDTIRRNNVGWEVKVWTDEECFALMDAYFSEFMKKYGREMNPRKLWDVVRIAILYVHGGIYLDHDVKCKPGVSFDAQGWADNTTELLLPFKEDASGQKMPDPTLRSLHMTHRRGNYFMGSVPGHPFWRVYWNNIAKLMPDHAEFWTLEHTGPRQLSHSFDEYIGQSGIPASIRLLPVQHMTTKGMRSAVHNRPDSPRVREHWGQDFTWQCTHEWGISPAELQEGNTLQAKRMAPNESATKSNEPTETKNQPVTKHAKVSKRMGVKPAETGTATRTNL